MTEPEIYQVLIEQETTLLYQEGLREWARRKGTLDALQIEAARRAEQLLPQEDTFQALGSQHTSGSALQSPQQTTPTQQPATPLSAMDRVQADLQARLQRRGR